MSRSYSLPAFAPSLAGEYFWEVGPNAGRVPEASGILREFGFEYRIVFGVAIKRYRKAFGVFNWVDVVVCSTFPVENNDKSIGEAARIIFSSFQKDYK